MRSCILRGLKLSALSALVLALFSVHSAFGQGVTTSNITGFVTDQSGHPVAGATVVAIHDPSGTRSTAVTRSNGEFNITGLRPGGPYTVSVTANNFETVNQTGVFVEVGNTFTTTVAMKPSEVVHMEAVTVAESPDPQFDSSVMGTGSTFSTAQIAGISSVRQDIQDVVNTDPRVVVNQSGNNDVEYNFSAQGQNPRENLFLIDGVSATDNFGLNSNGYAGLRNPLPLPWIESMTLELNDYDVTFSNYLGGLVDATLKSGTNDFHGSLYEMYEGTNFRGPDPSPNIPNTHEPLQNHTTGGTFSGPIIKDKLFFFVGYEAFREISAPPAQAYFPEDNATDTAVVNQILAKAASLGDTNQGTFVATNHSWEQNAVAKLDWNISDSQKFEVTFRHTAGLNPLFYNYTSSTETSLSGSWYNSYRVDQSLTAKLNSDWSQFIPGLSTELEATYKRYNGTATLNGTDYPAMTIYMQTEPGNVSVGQSAYSTAFPPYELFLGTYTAYQDNALHTNEQEMHGYGEYSIGAHTIKFGIQTDETLWNNTFISSVLGSYTFSNISDFLNQTPTGYSLAAPNAGYNLASAIAHAQMTDYEPLIQDTWKPNENLTLLAGVRMDYPYLPQKPILNQDYVAAFGTTNQGTINGNYTISPRFGFNYTLPGDQKTQIRGGAGLFLGQNPLVWLENSYSTAGQLTSYSSPSSNSTVPVPGLTFTGPGSLPATASAGTAAPSIDAADPNFHWPANWKENIAIDRQLPWLGLVFTAEMDLSQVQKGVYTEEMNLKPATSGPAFMPDGAIRYAGNITGSNIGTANEVSAANVNPAITNFTYNGGVNSSTYSTSSFFQGYSSNGAGGQVQLHPQVAAVYYLTNTDKGGSQEYTLQLARPLTDDWGFSLAYTHTHATEVSSLAGTTASSDAFSDPFVNPNDNTPYRSLWAEPDKVVLTLDKRFHFFKIGHSATTISTQFIAETGVPYSFVFKGDADGSSLYGQELFYVPSGPNDPKVSWLNTTEETNFFNWLNGTPELKKYEGQIAPRNAFYGTFQHTLNLYVEQQVPVYGPFRVALFADCYNFANLLNKNWGLNYNYGTYDADVRTVAATGYNALGNGGAGQYIYTFNAGTVNTPTVYADESRWAITIGARLEF